MQFIFFQQISYSAGIALRNINAPAPLLSLSREGKWRYVVLS